MLKILHFSDIHMGSGFIHGRINPATGLNTRLEDFEATLGRCIDRAIALPVDLVLFGGDAFPDATPPPYVAEAFANQFRRLVDAQIPTVLLVGNHDQHTQGQGGASLCIYRSLGGPGGGGGARRTTHRIPTRQGPVQVITLPWLTRSTLLTRPDAEGLSMGEVGQLLGEKLRVALEGEIRQLDPQLPTILLAHLMADTARFGAERFLAVGKGFTVPLTLLTRDCFDYVALGHVHRHQILSEQPPVVYPGSIERVDFSEEKEDKGYVLVTLQKGQAQVEFCPLPTRAFRTIEVDVSKAQQPQAQLLKKLKSDLITDAVVRLIYRIRSEQLEQVDIAELHQALASAHSYTIHAELVSQLSRPRLPELGVGLGIAPLEALQSYLDNREDLQPWAAEMRQAAEGLLLEDGVPEDLQVNPPTEAAGAPSPTRRVRENAPTYETQLRLL